jgi:hypothetical protein
VPVIEISDEESREYAAAQPPAGAISHIHDSGFQMPPIPQSPPVPPSPPVPHIPGMTAVPMREPVPDLVEAALKAAEGFSVNKEEDEAAESEAEMIAAPGQTIPPPVPQKTLEEAALDAAASVKPKIEEAALDAAASLKPKIEEAALDAAASLKPKIKETLSPALAEIMGINSLDELPRAAGELSEEGEEEPEEIISPPFASVAAPPAAPAVSPPVVPPVPGAAPPAVPQAPEASPKRDILPSPDSEFLRMFPGART